MNKFLICTMLFLTGCTTSVPVRQKFPEAPEALQTTCPNLQQLKSDVVLSDVSKVIQQNYALYHNCQLLQKSWIDWYKEQRAIYKELEK
jgi:hypothetical protein